MYDIPLISLGTGNRRRLTQNVIPYPSAPDEVAPQRQQPAQAAAPMAPRPTDSYFRRANNVAAEYGRANRLMQGNPTQQAAGQTRMLKADLLAAPILGQNYVSNRTSAVDENSRQNQTTGANVRMADAYTGQMVPALAGTERARAADFYSQARERDVVAPSIASRNEGAGALDQSRAGQINAQIPYIPGQMQAETKATEATAGKTAAEAQAVPERVKIEGRVADNNALAERLALAEDRAQQAFQLMARMKDVLAAAGIKIDDGDAMGKAMGGGQPTQQPSPDQAPAAQPAQQPAQRAGGGQLTPELAKQFLQQAGGDKNRAREMARQAGYTF